jgi:hypothetical protein
LTEGRKVDGNMRKTCGFITARKEPHDACFEAECGERQVLECPTEGRSLNLLCGRGIESSQKLLGVGLANIEQ